MEDVVSRLERVAAQLERVKVRFDSDAATSIAASTAPPAPPAASPAAAQPITSSSSSSPSLSSSSSVSAYQKLLDTQVSNLLNAAEALGGEVLGATRILSDAFHRELQIIAAFASCPKPTDPSALQPVLQPTAEKIMEAGTLTSGPRSQYADHFKTVAEAVQALTWVAYQPGCGLALPPQHVEDAWSAAEFYANKVLMGWKGKGPEHGEWIAALKAAVTALKDYCSEYHKNGPVWNSAGTGDVSTFKYDKLKSSSAPAPAAPSKKAGPPPPPPPPPPGTLIQPKQQQPASAAPAPSTGGAMAALFAEINKGTAVTGGLRKVTDDMKTKNRSDRIGTVTSSTTSTTGTATSTSTKKPASTLSPPRVECEQGRKWAIENQISNRDLIIKDTEPKQTVYIYNCHDSTIQVHGKVNAITLDGCTRSGLVFDTVVSSCEVVNCTSVQIQCTGAAPTISVEKTDGCQLFMYGDALEHTEITSAKISEFNVVALNNSQTGGGDGGGGGATGEEVEPQEFAIPEQYVSRYRNGKMVTEIVTHSGG